MRVGEKPTKPRPDFPLFAHASGQWAKRINNRVRYFGVWANPDAALKRFQAERDDLYAGRDPRAADAEAVTLRELVNHFLTLKRQQMDGGELTGQAWAAYHSDCEELLAAIDRHRPASSIQPADFLRLRATVAKTKGPSTLAVFLVRIRTLFKFGFDVGLLSLPVRFGPGFEPPPRRTRRLQRAKAGPRLIAPEVARVLLDTAEPQLRAMLLLGLNCGFGQTDCAELRRPALAVRPGWIDALRPKTGSPRRCPLWPETIAALQKVADVRPSPLDRADGGRVFLTPKGVPWVRFLDKGPEIPGARIDAVRSSFSTLVARAKVKVNGGFYTLRHTFRTVADECKDQPAAMLIMGHTDQTISGHYRESIADERLLALANYVRAWLWPS